MPTPRTATPPQTPSHPNGFVTLRARSAASEEPITTVAAQPAPGAASATSRVATAATWSARNEAPPATTTLAKKPSGS